ncbi:hypothetical protein B0T14DRAFT_583316 [Immersiella caudata]|uniref:Uncharacterized protein n=1 Tax=Immersiella caudata TaxID=314043 RepID=A0AA39WYR5_9PEZI|nr:hypothetical protein B0T14DRAFT_583316 [Immersiella caudata]
MPWLGPLGLAPLLGEVLSLIIAGAAIGDSVADFCHQSPGPGCINKRDLDALGLPGVPVLDVKRSNVGPCNVPMYNFDICRDQIRNQGAQIWSSIPAAGVAQFDNIPPACMNLAVVLSGSCTGEGARPVPCGSACMQYHGLGDDQFRILSSYLSRG